MTSILQPEHYYDIIAVDHQRIVAKEYTMESDPLAIVIQMVFDREPRSYWNRGYKAHWKITGDSLYLIDLSGSIDGQPISMQSLFTNEMREANRVLADWYSDEIKIIQEFIVKEINGTEYDCSSYRHYHVAKGHVISYNDTYEEIKTNNLPF